MTETLIVVVDHRNEYSISGKSLGSARYGSSQSREFREINCRACELGGGLLPSPLKVSSAPLSKGYLSSPRTQAPTVCENSPSNLKSGESGDGGLTKRNFKSSPIPINFNGGRKESPQTRNTLFSELWAGPAYSNSPPPSSLPIPRFSLKPKRSVSLELPRTSYEIIPYSSAKSAPSSPTRELKHSAITFLHNDDKATMTLRRILNLDVVDD